MAQDKIESTGGIEASIKATPKAVQRLVSDAARAQELIYNEEAILILAENTHLKAEKAELLEELKTIVQGWDDVGKNVRQLTPWELERRDFAREIIAKVETVENTQTR